MLSKTDLEEKREAIDRIGSEHLFYFAKHVLGYSLLEQKPHHEVCDYAQSTASRTRRGLDLEPRGTFKTTIFSQALPIWLIKNNPDIRILLDSAVLQNSQDNLGVIERQFEGNQRLRYLFGDFVGDHWNNEEMTVKKRRRHDLKEPTVRCASAERVQVGPHYDVIIADDLVSLENSKTLDSRRQIKDHFRLLFSLLEPDGVLYVVGTRWNYDDLYGLIIEEFPEFVPRIKRAIEPDGSLYFEKRLPKKVLDDILAKQGRDIYNGQYLNDPAPEDADSKFQVSWFKSYAKLPEKRFGFIAIDPGGEKKGSDEWAIMTAYTDEENFTYFDKLLIGHYRSDKAWDLLFDLLPYVKPMAVGLETTGGQKWLAEALKAEMRRRSTHFNLIELPHAGDSKEFRILNLQPRYRAGSILHSRAMGPLEDQLRRFPKGKDDVADVASMILEIAYAPMASRAKEDAPKSLDEYFIRSHRESDAAKRRPRHALLGDQW